MEVQCPLGCGFCSPESDDGDGDDGAPVAVTTTTTTMATTKPEATSATATKAPAPPPTAEPPTDGGGGTTTVTSLKPATTAEVDAREACTCTECCSWMSVVSSGIGPACSAALVATAQPFCEFSGSDVALYIDVAASARTAELYHAAAAIVRTLEIGPRHVRIAVTTFRRAAVVKVFEFGTYGPGAGERETAALRLEALAAAAAASPSTGIQGVGYAFKQAYYAGFTLAWSRAAKKVGGSALRAP
jgi:hypothetical protein